MRLDIQSCRNRIVCTGTIAYAVSTTWRNLWTVVTDVWWWACCLVIADHTFSINERFDERAAQSNSLIFSVSRKVRSILATLSCSLSCWNITFHGARIKSRITGFNTIEICGYYVQSIFDWLAKSIGIKEIKEKYPDRRQFTDMRAV